MRLLILFLWLAGTACAAVYNQAYTFAAGGQSTCLTFGPTSVMRASGLSGGVSTPGPGCNVQEDLGFQESFSSAVTAVSSVNLSDTSSFGSYTVTGSAQASAGAGILGTYANISLNGATDGSTAKGTEALAISSESIDPTTGIINGGTIRFTLTFHGLADFVNFTANNTAGDAVFGLYYRDPGASGASPIFFGAAGRSGNYTWYNGQYQTTSGNGVTFGTTSVAVNKTLQFETAFSSSTPYLTRLLLYSAAFPGINGTLTADFIHTVTVDNIEVFDNQGASVPFLRGSLAAPDVPEPSIPALLTSGLALLFVLNKRKQRGLSGDARNHPAGPHSLR